MFKRTVLLFLVVYVVPFVLFAQEDPRTGAEMVTEMGRGINLGNVLSAPTEGDWAAPVTEQYFIDVAAAGFTNVRIPVDFFGTRTTGDINGASTASYSPEIGTVSQYTGEIFTIDSDYLERVKTVINWSIAQGLVTILDFHGQHLKSDFVKTFDSDEGASTSPTSARRAADNAKFRAIWTQLALEFEDHSYKLVFEIINEPYIHMSKDDMDTLNDEILAIIRVGGNNPQRNIIVTGGGETSYNAITQIEPILFDNTPNRLIGSFHYYNPYDFTSSSLATGNDYDWGAADQGEVDTHFTTVKSWTDANDVPVFLGEFGADNTDGYNYSTGDLNTVSANATNFADGGPDNASRVAYHSYVAEQSINRGFSFAAWDAGPKSNKTIHKRTDNPSSVNYNRNNFSVIGYNPKNTNRSSVLDTSVWVEDVKNALLISGTWPLCYGPGSDPIIHNPDFECGYNFGWSLKSLSNSTANISDSGATDAYNGDAAAKIVVETNFGYNKVLLENSVFNNDLNGKTIALNCYAKSDDATSFRFQIKAIYTSGTVRYLTSPVLSLQTGYNAYEYSFDLTDPTTSIQVKVLCGNQADTYYTNLPDSISACDSVQICVDSIAGGSYSWSISNTSNSGNLAIGDTYQGGIVFWLDGNGGGLIAAPSDQSTETDWGCTGSDISGADGTAIGTGNQNTIDIEAGCSTPGTAADICANLTLGGYSDWFLPSKDELNEMYQNKSTIGGFANNYYWSSTEFDSGPGAAWLQDFSDGNQLGSNKYNNFTVRSVRAF